MSRRYTQMFERLTDAGGRGGREGALVPCVMLGDPTPAASLAVIEALLAGGADALELGVPFSDPVADGPTIQDAHLRALDAGTDVDACFEVIEQVRGRHPEVPIGLLIYANVPFARGLAEFYSRCAQVGVDSVLVPDVPVRESADFTTAALAAGVDPVYIAPPSASEATLAAVAASTRGYVYAVSRVGVTGTEREAETVDLPRTVASLRADAAAPVLLGFGISRPEHVRAALVAGADGAITGSAVVRIVGAHAQAVRAEEENEEEAADVPGPALAAMQTELGDFVGRMKAATRA